MVHFLSVLQGDHRELIHFAYSLMDQSLITNSISIMRITWGKKGKNLNEIKNANQSSDIFDFPF
jgi:hypothetical protein